MDETEWSHNSLLLVLVCSTMPVLQQPKFSLQAIAFVFISLYPLVKFIAGRKGERMTKNAYNLIGFYFELAFPGRAPIRLPSMTQIWSSGKMRFFR